MSSLLRIGLAIWGLFFGFIAIRGIIDPQTFTETFGLVGEGAARNALRADFGAFFLFGAIPALVVAALPNRAHWLNLPAILFGGVLILRFVGVAIGDEPNMIAMVTEAASVLLLVIARHVLGQVPAPIYRQSSQLN